MDTRSRITGPRTGLALRMIARKRLDIGWRDFAYGAAACAGVAALPPLRRPLLTCRADAIICLSVRSGLDLLLAELGWPEGSEVLVSAITIPDIPRILRAHGLVPVPVDVDPDTLALDEAMLGRARTPRTRALLIAHLFGARMPTGRLAAWARQHNVMLLEDCAQAFTGDEFAGNEKSDVRMFSFGPIKTATALGGAVLLLRDAALLARLKRRHAALPVQSTAAHAGRMVKLAFFNCMLAPRIYTAVVAAFRIAGRDHDDAITRLGRSFSGSDFFTRLRQQPCAALVRLLEWRLATYDRDRVARRAAAGERLRLSLRTLRPLAAAAPARTHWLFPLRVADPHAKQRELWAAGFDAARGASSLYALPASPGQERAVKAEAAMRDVLYLPVHGEMTGRVISRLAACLEPPMSGATISGADVRVPSAVRAGPWWRTLPRRWLRPARYYAPR